MSHGNLYLAGPMRGLPEFGFPAFADATHALRRDGFAVFSPAERDLERGFDPSGMEGTSEELAALDFDLREALGADLAFITRKATGLAVLDGWERSSGARAEVATALALGLPVGTVSSWLASNNYDEPTECIESVPPVEALQPVALNLSAEALGIPLTTITTLDGEVRSVDPDTGAEKGVKLARFDLIPAGPLTTLAEHYGRGALKYADRNWEAGYYWSKSYAALMRHVVAWWSGEDLDPETGSPHLAAVAWHAFALQEWSRTHPEKDDRPVSADLSPL